MNKKNERKFILILQVTAGVAVIGIALLIYTRWQNGPSAIFDLMAYVVSIAALAMTTLQSISISKQMKVTQDGSDKIEATVVKLEELIASEKVTTQALNKDIKLDEENEQMVRGLFQEENEIEHKIESLIAELKKHNK